MEWPFFNRNEMKTQRLSLSIHEDCYHLRLTAPPENRTDAGFFDDLQVLLNRLDTQNNVRGLIISSLGRHFSSGADICELMHHLGKGEAREQHTAQFHSNLFNRLKTKSYPVVCAIQGCCLGSGLELALACHYRIASSNALLGLPETSYRLMPGCGGTVYLPQLVGLGKSIEIILGENNLLAEDAVKIGLIDMVVDKKDLLPTAVRIISRHSENLPNQ